MPDHALEMPIAFCKYASMRIPQGPTENLQRSDHHLGPNFLPSGQLQTLSTGDHRPDGSKKTACARYRKRIIVSKSQ